MNSRFLVRCTAASARSAMTGIYSAGLTSNGMIATWKQERATRYETEAAAACAAARLGKKFSGTWEVFHA